MRSRGWAKTYRARSHPIEIAHTSSGTAPLSQLGESDSEAPTPSVGVAFRRYRSDGTAEALCLTMTSAEARALASRLLKHAYNGERRARGDIGALSLGEAPDSVAVLAPLAFAERLDTVERIAALDSLASRLLSESTAHRERFAQLERFARSVAETGETVRALADKPGALTDSEAQALVREYARDARAVLDSVAAIRTGADAISAAVERALASEARERGESGEAWRAYLDTPATAAAETGGAD